MVHTKILILSSFILTLKLFQTGSKYVQQKERKIILVIHTTIPLNCQLLSTVSVYNTNRKHEQFEFCALMSTNQPNLKLTLKE